MVGQRRASSCCDEWWAFEASPGGLSNKQKSRLPWWHPHLAFHSRNGLLAATSEAAQAHLVGRVPLHPRPLSRGWPLGPRTQRLQAENRACDQEEGRRGTWRLSGHRVTRPVGGRGVWQQDDPRAVHLLRLSPVTPGCHPAFSQGGRAGGGGAGRG